MRSPEDVLRDALEASDQAERTRREAARLVQAAIEMTMNTLMFASKIDHSSMWDEEGHRFYHAKPTPSDAQLEIQRDEQAREQDRKFAQDARFGEAMRQLVDRLGAAQLVEKLLMAFLEVRKTEEEDEKKV